MANNKNTMSDAEFEAQLLAGSQPATYDSGKKGMIDLLHNTFGADDLVKIKNFTDETTGWVYSDRKTTQIEQPNEFTRRVTQGGQKTRVLKPGSVVIVAGWEAYIGVVRFFKQYCQSKGSVADMNSPKAQKDFLDKAFVGIYDPNKEAEPEEDVKKEVEKDLGLSDGKAKA